MSIPAMGQRRIDSLLEQTQRPLPAEERNSTFAQTGPILVYTLAITGSNWRPEQRKHQTAFSQDNMFNP